MPSVLAYLSTFWSTGFRAEQREVNRQEYEKAYRQWLQDRD